MIDFTAFLRARIISWPLLSQGLHDIVLHRGCITWPSSGGNYYGGYEYGSKCGVFLKSFNPADLLCLFNTME